MAFTTVVTHATGDVLPASDWNTYIRDNLAFVHTGVTRQILTATGTYTTPVGGVAALVVECIGGGGAGGGAAATGAGNDSVGAGGNGGYYAMGLIVAPAASYTYIIGAGGAGVSGAAGNAGGATSFGPAPIVRAPGGQPGGSGGPSNAIPFAAYATLPVGTGAVGDLILPGQVGDAGIALSTTYPIGGRGGAAARGGAGGAGGPGGNAGSLYGGGGSGVGQSPSLGAVTGAAGAAGVIIVWEIY